MIIEEVFTMNFTVGVDTKSKQGVGSPAGRPGVCRRACALQADREARAPPTAGATTDAGSQ